MNLPLWCQLILYEGADGTVTDDRYLTAKELADKLKVSQKTVLRWARAGKLKGRKAGRDWRFVDGDFWASPQDRPPVEGEQES